MFHGLDGLLDSEESDSFDESMREGSATTNGKPKGPYEYVQFELPVEMDHQVPMSKESSEVTSHGCSETCEGDVGCMKLA